MQADDRLFPYPWSEHPPVAMSPREFELWVKEILESKGMGKLEEFSVSHRQRLTANDGAYEIDIMVSFVALGEAKFKVLVECKHLKRKVERCAVELLLSRIRSTGSQKGIIFSTSAFQSGAVEFAETHGIGLVHVVDASTRWVVNTNAAILPGVILKQFLASSRWVGWMFSNGGAIWSAVSPDDGEQLRQFLAAKK